ncbi:hypothetical protein JI747_018295 [Chryseobacterium sp. RG1]|uniref:Uncharacterized protein n=1 Tax=Chryseobacterium tagetis TaxID=2801334 RepID=A0ABS8A8N0_9FLAO|nr:hypothetical protein [Chryseobacterium tagetis]MCA6069121.1 hypothetical protein [Chryseobacterium tagetis]
MYRKHFILIFFLFASLKCFAQEAVRLNIKLYPIQTLSVPSNNSVDIAENRTATVAPDAKFIKVSSLSGFQVKMHREIYNAEKKAFAGEKPNTEYALIDKRKGGMDEKIAISNNFLPAEEVKNSNPELNNIYHTLVYTIISQ